MRNKNIWKAVLLLLVGLIAFSCERRDEDPENKEGDDDLPRIEVGEMTIKVSAEKQMGRLFYIAKNPIKGVTSTAVSDVEWIHDISVGGGNVSFWVDLNDDIERTGNIHMAYSDAASADVTVIQSAAAEELYLNSSDIHFQFEGGKCEVTGYSSRKWTLVGGNDWVKVDETSGGPGYFSINLDVMANLSKTEIRRVDYIFHLSNSEKTCRLIISQDKDIRPEYPLDPKPSNTNFFRKVLLTDFCGTNAFMSPIMQEIYRDIFADSEYSKKAVLTSAHMFTKDDPAYFSSNFASAMNVRYFPTLIVNLNKNIQIYAANASVASLQQLIDNAGTLGTLAGLAANSVVYDNYLYVNASVKSAVTKLNDYRVAVWILEDGIYGIQSGAPDESYNVHNNCVRAISTGPENDYYGIATEPMALAMREVGNASFRIKLSSSWNKSKLRYIVVVSTQAEDGLYEVCNVDGARLGESIQYNYFE